jgi:hypothetical protein
MRNDTNTKKQSIVPHVDHKKIPPTSHPAFAEILPTRERGIVTHPVQTCVATLFFNQAMDAKAEEPDDSKPELTPAEAEKRKAAIEAAAERIAAVVESFLPPNENPANQTAAFVYR